MRTNEAIQRLNAATNALADIDVSGWSEDSLRDQLGDLSVALCALDAVLSRVAEQIRARGHRIEEPLLAV